MNITEAIVSMGHGSLYPSYFCVHSTANPGATDENHVAYWSRNPTFAVHLVSDWDSCYNTVPYNKLCYQVGNGNAYVEGLEICEATNRADFDKGIHIAAEVVANRLSYHGWGTDRLISHRDATYRWGGSDHVDPHPYFERWGYSWDKFVSLVQFYLDGGKQEEPEPEPEVIIEKKEEDEMQLIIKPNCEERLVYFNGADCFALTHPDQLEALDMVYGATHDGKLMPRLELGSKDAPWYNRLLQACGGKEKLAPATGVTLA